MKKLRPESPQSASLRKRAEKAFREREELSSEKLDALSPESLRASLHELHVHQIELEMQNEDLLRAQADLDASRARYFDLYELAPVGYCTVSKKGLILETNLTAATLFGVERGALVGRGLSNFISKEDQELYYLCRKKLLDTLQPQECDLQMLRHDGTAFFAHLEIAVARDENGEPVCRVALIDVTDVKELENTLRESEMHFRTLADSGQALIWTSGIDKNCNYFNRVWLDFTGRSLEQELGDGWTEGVHPDDLDPCFHTYVEAFNRRAPFSMDYRLRRHDGEYRWLEDQGTPRHNSDGEFLGYIGHCLDISDRKQAETMQRESEARYAQLAEQSLIVVWEVDAQGLYTYASQVSETVWGYRPDELVGRKHFYDLHPESRREEFKAAAFTIFARKQPFLNLVNPIQTKDGRQLWVSTNGAPILNGEGTLCGYRGSDTDITERKLAEQELRALEEQYRDILQTAMDGFCMVDMQGRIQAVNASYCRMTGYSEEELLTMGVADLEAVMPPEDIASTIQKIIAQGGSRFESRHQRKDGTIIDVDVSVQFRASDNALVSFLHDITERKRTEGALREAHLELEERVKNRTEELNRSNAQLQLLLDSTAEAIYGIDTHGECTFCNPACLRMLGYKSEDELLGKNMYRQIHHKHADGTRIPVEECRIFRAFQENEASHADDEVLWRADGTSFSAEYWSYPQRIDGVAVGTVVTFIDITERMQQEEARRRLIDRLALATEAGQVGIWDYDIATNELVWDDQMFALYGITRDQFSGAYSAWTAGLHPDDRERGDQEIQAAISGEKDFDTAFRVVWPDGSTHHVRAMALVQRDANGKPLHIIGTNWDISEHKRAEIAVLENVKRAEEFARLKSRFVSMASHELRTSLANIMLACELLQKFGTTLPAERAQSILSGLVDGVASMVQTLNDLLLAGKIEEGKLPFTPARFALLAFLKRCCLEVQPEPPARIEIAFLDAGLGVTADERLLHHVLKNLLENALKYSPPDTKVELGVEAGPDSLTLSVRDRGIGVPVAEREFLFDAFSRASNVGDNPGSGLGLFIAQKCAQTHGGKMRYAPQPDGSVFSVTIPLATTERKTRRDDIQRPTRNIQS